MRARTLLRQSICGVLCTPIAAALILACMPTPAQSRVATAPTVYQGKAVTPPKGAGYVLPNGSIQIIGCREMSGIIRRLDALFAKSHPGERLALDSRGNNTTAMYGLTFDASLLAPMDGRFTSLGLIAMRKVGEAPPLGIRIAHASLNPAAKLSPLAIIVNRTNPINALTVRQVKRIFTEGSLGGDITHWGQLGLSGEWLMREIDPVSLPGDDYYPSEDPQFADYMLHQFSEVAAPFSPATMARAGHFTRTDTMVPRYGEVVQRVRDNPEAIGITTLNRITPGVKLVAVKQNEWSPPLRGTASEIAAGTYPYDRYLYIYLRRVHGRPIDPVAEEYVRLALSHQGQNAIAKDSRGYIPLNTAEIQEELGKLP